MADQSPVRIDVVSDVVCPWCFIGKKRLEKALALKPQIAAEVHFRPYFLNDWIPREGISREDYLTKKFGSVDRYNGMAGRVVAAAAAEGLVYNKDKISRQPNTLDCHRLIRWADANGQAAKMKQRLMDLYFTQGADLSDREVLAGAAADVGLDAGDVRAWLASDKDVAAIEQEANAAKESGIDGVPCFIIGGMYAISGARLASGWADVGNVWSVRVMRAPIRFRGARPLTALRAIFKMNGNQKSRAVPSRA